MDLYLMRHGRAHLRGTYANDDERPLTEEGIKRTTRVAKQLLELNLHWEEVLTSPLVRARQTAEILLTTGLTTSVVVVDSLAPDGSLEEWLEWNQKRESTGPIALVGHEPDLSIWAETLIWGEVRGVLSLKKAGLMGLNVPDSGPAIGKSLLFWLTPPRLLG